MPSFNFKRNIKFYVVTDGLKYQLEINPDISFSQTFEEDAQKVKTLHAPKDMFSSATIVKASPANFNFTMPLHTHTEVKPILDLLLKYDDTNLLETTLKAVDLYVDTGEEIFKLQTAVFERGTFNLDKAQVVSVSISGTAAKLSKFGPSGAAIPGVLQSSTVNYALPEYIECRFLEVLVNGVEQKDIVGLSVEVANNVNWVPYDNLHKSLAISGPSDTVYPEAFVVSDRTLSGVVQQYLTDENIDETLTWDTNATVKISVGNVFESFKLVFDIPNAVYTSRVDASELFLNGYDFRMVSNPQDLSEVVVYGDPV